MISLPSKRTLKDYTHWYKPSTGFQNETFIQLLEDYNILEVNEAQRLVSIL